VRTAATLDAQLAALKQLNFFNTLVALKQLTAQQAALLQKVASSNVEFNNPVRPARPTLLRVAGTTSARAWCSITT
jgi:hypothetical protein